MNVELYNWKVNSTKNQQLKLTYKCIASPAKRNIEKKFKEKQ